jgi:hypothetical protein
MQCVWSTIKKNTDRRKQKYLKKTCPSATFYHHKSHTDWPGIAVLKACAFKTQAVCIIKMTLCNLLDKCSRVLMFVIVTGKTITNTRIMNTGIYFKFGSKNLCNTNNEKYSYSKGISNMKDYL